MGVSVRGSDYRDDSDHVEADDGDDDRTERVRSGIVRRALPWAGPGMPGLPGMPGNRLAIRSYLAGDLG